MEEVEVETLLELETPVQPHWKQGSSYPTYHKMTGQLTQDIYSTLGYNTLLLYVTKIYNIARGAWDGCNLVSLHRYLSSLKPHNHLQSPN